MGLLVYKYKATIFSKYFSPCSAKVQTPIHLAVELRVVDVELERLGEDLGDVLLEVRQSPLDAGRVSVEHKLHQLRVLQDVHLRRVE